MTDHALELALAEARYCRERVALMRARLYRSGLGSSHRLEQLERQLQQADRRLAEVRSRETSRDEPSGSAPSRPGPQH